MSSWLMKLPYMVECRECHQLRQYFKVNGNHAVISEIAECWDCYVRKHQEQEALRRATEREA